MNITEKAAYIQGLAEGLGLGNETKEEKVISQLLSLVSDMAEQITVLTAEAQELRDYIEEIDQDLGQVEEDLYVTDGEEDTFEDEDDEDYEADGTYYEVECPNCGEKVCFDDSLTVEELICPACGEKITDVELCDGDCDCCEGCENE